MYLTALLHTNTHNCSLITQNNTFLHIDTSIHSIIIHVYVYSFFRLENAFIHT